MQVFSTQHSASRTGCWGQWSHRYLCSRVPLAPFGTPGTHLISCSLVTPSSLITQHMSSALTHTTSIKCSWRGRMGGQPCTEHWVLPCSQHSSFPLPSPGPCLVLNWKGKSCITVLIGFVICLSQGSGDLDITRTWGNQWNTDRALPWSPRQSHRVTSSAPFTQLLMLFWDHEKELYDMLEGMKY